MWAAITVLLGHRSIRCGPRLRHVGHDYGETKDAAYIRTESRPTSHRNWWPTSNGITGPHRPEYAAGRLRHIAVGIERSTFHPLEVPQLIEECFNQILAAADAIDNPFEQALFIMVQLPYLQPFDDVNKRVSRLAANIPFIKRNLSPLSFTDVPQSLYTDAILSVYERNEIDLLKDVFIWAYGRSAEQYAAVRQSLGDPDPFRFKHSAALRQIVSEVVRDSMDRRAATAHIARWVEENITAAERERFREMAEAELLNLHEGNFARYLIRPSEFAAWEVVWRPRR